MGFESKDDDDDDNDDNDDNDDDGFSFIVTSYFTRTTAAWLLHQLYTVKAKVIVLKCLRCYHPEADSSKALPGGKP